MHSKRQLTRKVSLPYRNAHHRWLGGCLLIQAYLDANDVPDLFYGSGAFTCLPNVVRRRLRSLRLGRLSTSSGLKTSNPIDRFAGNVFNLMLFTLPKVWRVPLMNFKQRAENLRGLMRERLRV